MGIKVREWIKELGGRREVEILSAFPAIVLAYALMYFLHIYCPIKFITGISCAGCGMTRAWLALLHLDLKSAFSYHPLFFIPPIAVLLYLYKSKIPKRIYDVIIFTIIALFIIIYLFRLVSPTNDVVVFHPQDGAVMKGIQYIFRGI